MNIYEKLMEARVRLHAMELKKSGRNNFSNYDYFELGDFLPQTLIIFHDLKMCGVVSFKADEAVLAIINVEKPDETILITSPMAEAALKGAHGIQNLGAVQTYLRRYLWADAMEIVEHDAVDSSDKVDAAKTPPKSKAMPPRQEQTYKPPAPTGMLTELEFDEALTRLEASINYIVLKQVFGDAWKRATEEQRTVLQNTYETVKKSAGWK